MRLLKEEIAQFHEQSLEKYDGLDPHDLYVLYKKLQMELELIQVQEDYIKEEQRNLKKEFIHAQEEVKRIKAVPLVIGQFLEAVDENNGIVASTTGSNYYVRVLSTIDREQLKPSSSVGLHKQSNCLVDLVPPEADSTISMLSPDEKPDISYSDIGGLDIQKQEALIPRAASSFLDHLDVAKPCWPRRWPITQLHPLFVSWAPSSSRNT
ncbi:26S proteasome regulatory subunit 6B isoform X2 [Drosophila sechellia]|uniref:26S proteasome regulatory subunit 6B isoform X2 n=1 Tax=Drosophila sechellia TaxID=7238 RepID=UPI0013DD8B49|nr:26S proteasome regulatory subunit 6B isoform X2 [Drosophila sechellia]